MARKTKTEADAPEHEPATLQSVREERTPCPTCGSDSTRVLRTDTLPTTPYFDPAEGREYPGRIRRTRRCDVCERRFFSNQGISPEAEA